MTTMAKKPATLQVSMLSVAFSSLLMALSFTTLASAQAAISLSENAKISPVTIAQYCDNNLSDTNTKTWQRNYQSARQYSIACMQQQLKPYQLASMSASQQYFAYKAQAWLNYANHEDSINSRTAAGEYAFNDAKIILQALENGAEDDLDLVADIPKTSALMRPDLWANVSALKDSGGIASAPRELAFSEVSLVWAAADHCEHGWRSSSPHFRMADRWLEQAREAFVNANDSVASVAMQELAVSYYQQYESLDPSDDICRGQVLPKPAQMPISLSMADAATLDKVTIASVIPSPEPIANYNIAN